VINEKHSVWRAVSATRYVTYKKKKERFSECGAGLPAYTMLCTKCFVTTKYHAARIAAAIETKTSNWPAPRIVEASQFSSISISPEVIMPDMAVKNHFNATKAL
jgi:hypothetical protein